MRNFKLHTFSVFFGLLISGLLIFSPLAFAMELQDENNSDKQVENKSDKQDENFYPTLTKKLKSQKYNGWMPTEYNGLMPTDDEILEHMPKNVREMDLSQCAITGSCFKSLPEKLKILILTSEQFEKIDKEFFSALPKGITVKIKYPIEEITEIINSCDGTKVEDLQNS